VGKGRTQEFYMRKRERLDSEVGRRDFSTLADEFSLKVDGNVPQGEEMDTLIMVCGLSRVGP